MPRDMRKILSAKAGNMAIPFQCEVSSQLIGIGVWDNWFKKEQGRFVNQPCLLLYNQFRLLEGPLCSESNDSSVFGSVITAGVSNILNHRA